MKILFLAIFAISCASTLHAQDPEFSQFYANPLYTNPAMAGTSTKHDQAAGRAVVNYRNQWPTASGGFNTFTASWDQAFRKLHGGLGVQIINDNIARGLIIQNEVRAFYSFRAWLDKEDKNKLYCGIQFGLANKSLDMGRISFGDQLRIYGPDSSLSVMAVPRQSMGYSNAAMGLLYSNPKFYAGFAIHNIIEPNISFYHNPDGILPRRYTTHAGYHLQPGSAQWALQPQALFMKQWEFTQLVAGTLFNRKSIQAGVWFRQTFGYYHNADAIIFNVGYQNDHFRIIYSYDMTISDARSASPGSHEFSLCYRWKTKHKNAANSSLIY